MLSAYSVDHDLHNVILFETPECCVLALRLTCTRGNIGGMSHQEAVDKQSDRLNTCLVTTTTTTLSSMPLIEVNMAIIRAAVSILY